MPDSVIKSESLKSDCIPVKADKSRELAHFFFFTTGKQSFSIVVSTDEIPDENMNFISALNRKP